MTTELNKSPPTAWNTALVLKRLQASTDMLEMLMQMLEPLTSDTFLDAWRKGVEINRSVINEARRQQ